MSQIIQITKKKTSSNFFAAETGDAKNAPVSDKGFKAADMIGLSWIFTDDPRLHFTSMRGGV